MGRPPACLTAHEMTASLRSGELTAAEITEQSLDRIEAVDGDIGAFIDLWDEAARSRAAAIDAMLGRGDDPGPLAGVPVALKDNFCTARGRTTCASKILELFESPYNATVVDRLEQAGAVLFGKLNMDEFAMGSSTENSSLQQTRNPWDLDRVPGGSSGGPAAAVSSGEIPAALGSDTGGSIRQPAAFCGCVGLKPTYGRVSRYGLVAYASSLDQIGPLTRDVKDMALLMNAISGQDPLDATSADLPVPDYGASLRADVSGLTVGLPKECFGEGLDGESRGKIEEAVEVLKAQGARVREVSLPRADYGVAAYYVIATAEASANLARFDGVRYGLRDAGASSVEDMYRLTKTAGFGPEVQRRILLGTYALSSGYYDAYYLKAQKVRALIRRDFEAAFGQCDVIVTPTAPVPAFRFGELADDPLEMYLSDVYTITANLAGLPGLSIPCGLTETGLPVGVQMLGRPFEEETLLRAAFTYEQCRGFSLGEPPMGPD